MDHAWNKQRSRSTLAHTSDSTSFREDMTVTKAAELLGIGRPALIQLPQRQGCALAGDGIADRAHLRSGYRDAARSPDTIRAPQRSHAAPCRRRTLCVDSGRDQVRRHRWLVPSDRCAAQTSLHSCADWCIRPDTNSPASIFRHSITPSVMDGTEWWRRRRRHHGFRKAAPVGSLAATRMPSARRIRTTTHA